MIIAELSIKCYVNVLCNDVMMDLIKTILITNMNVICHIHVKVKQLTTNFNVIFFISQSGTFLYGEIIVHTCVITYSLSSKYIIRF